MKIRKSQSQESPKSKGGQTSQEKLVHGDNLSTEVWLNALEKTRDDPIKRYSVRLSGRAKERYLSILINISQSKTEVLSHNDFMNYLLDSIEDPNIRLYNEMRQLEQLVKMNSSPDKYLVATQLMTILGKCLSDKEDPLEIRKKLEEAFFG